MSITNLISNYEQFVEKTWVLPGDHYNETESLAVCSMGLVGETGELLEKLEDFLFSASEKNRDLVVKELGDCFYYLVKVSNMSEVDLNALISKIPLVFPAQDEERCAFSLMKSVALSCEVLKKKIRKDPSFDFTHRLEQSLKPVLMNYFDLLYQLDISIKEVVDENIEKVSSRFSRGLIKGSGDLR